MSSDWEALVEAYRNTSYRVMLPGEWVDVRIGEPLPHVLTAMLQAAGKFNWAIVTAENPGSRQLNSAENGRRRQALEQQLFAQGKNFFLTKHIADDPAWPLERGHFVIGMTEKEAQAMGQAWGQKAVVVGSVCDLDRLCTTDHPRLLVV